MLDLVLFFTYRNFFIQTLELKGALAVLTYTTIFLLLLFHVRLQIRAIQWHKMSYFSIYSLKMRSGLVHCIHIDMARWRNQLQSKVSNLGHKIGFTSKFYKI